MSQRRWDEIATRAVQIITTGLILLVFWAGVVLLLAILFGAILGVAE